MCAAGLSNVVHTFFGVTENFSTATDNGRDFFPQAKIRTSFEISRKYFLKPNNPREGTYLSRLEGMMIILPRLDNYQFSQSCSIFLIYDKAMFLPSKTYLINWAAFRFYEKKAPSYDGQVKNL